MNPLAGCLLLGPAAGAYVVLHAIVLPLVRLRLEPAIAHPLSRALSTALLPPVLLAVVVAAFALAGAAPRAAALAFAAALLALVEHRALRPAEDGVEAAAAGDAVPASRLAAWRALRHGAALLASALMLAAFAAALLGR
ncbi:MAG: hypothetical protein ACK5TE_02415 [Pseudomonadota bacterium]